MRFAIVGAGGMGGAVAAFLARGGQDVILIGRNPAQAEAIEKDGLRVDAPGGEPFVTFPAVCADAARIPAGSVDALIVLTKSFDTAPAVASVRHVVSRDGIALTVQNGLGNDRILADGFGADRTLYGVTTIGGRLLSPNHLALTEHTARRDSVTHIGPFLKDPAGLKRAVTVAEALSAVGLPTVAMQDVSPAVWSKLVIAGMGPVGSIARRSVGTVWMHPEGQALLRRMFDEVVEVAAAEGVLLDREAVWAHASRTWAGTGNYLNSMNVDVLNRRPTEIDAIAAEVVRRAKAHGLQVPMHEFAVRMIRLIEGTYDSAW